MLFGADLFASKSFAYKEQDIVLPWTEKCKVESDWSEKGKQETEFESSKITSLWKLEPRVISIPPPDQIHSSLVNVFGAINDSGKSGIDLSLFALKAVSVESEAPSEVGVGALSLTLFELRSAVVNFDQKPESGSSSIELTHFDLRVVVVNHEQPEEANAGSLALTLFELVEV